MRNNLGQIVKLSVAALLLCAVIIGITIAAKQNTPSETSSLQESSAGLPSSDDSEPSQNSGEPSRTSEESSEYVFPAYKADEDIKAEYVVLYDETTGACLYERNADRKCYPASITKLLTALTACDLIANGETVTVGDEIDLIGQNSSVAYLGKGFVLTFAQLMDAMMIMSGNDAAYVMAAWGGRKCLGDENADNEKAIRAFVGLMNAKAAEIGMTSTHFVNPDGYHDPDHYTTPRDLAILCIAACKSDIIYASASKAAVSYRIYSGQTVNWTSTNTLLTSYEYATGLKTGTTDEAGYCLAASAEKDGREYIAVILAAESSASRFTAAAELFDMAFGIE